MPGAREWRGSVLAIRGRLYLQVKDEAGCWRQRALRLTDTPENRVTADRRLAEVRSAMLALHDATEGEGGPLTVERWCQTWLDRRDIADRENDRARLRLHVYPVIGAMRLEDVRPRHLVDVVDRMRAAGKAPRTIRNTYSVVKALYRDARIADVVTTPDPCILTHRQLGRIKDGPRFKRSEAVYSAAELAALVSDPRIPEDRRAWYALLGIGMLRTGEAAGLRWSNVQRGEPLGRLVVSRTYEREGTKTVPERWMPIHAVLAAVLAEWRLGGWARTMGRTPGEADLVCPMPPPTNRGPRLPAGSMRDKNAAHKRIVADLVTLGLRHRRGHDLRRTGISLAQDGGADSRVLRWGTHAPPGETIDAYTSLAWGTLCRAVAALRVDRISTPTDGTGSPDDIGRT
jgi:integrase